MHIAATSANSHRSNCPSRHELHVHLQRYCFSRHVPRRFRQAYLREFIECSRRGMLVFGVQTPCRTGRLFPAASRPPCSSHPVQDQGRGEAGTGRCKCHCLPERVFRGRWVRQDCGCSIHQHGGEGFQRQSCVYLRKAPTSGYVGKQYCVVRSRGRDLRVSAL